MVAAPRRHIVSAGCKMRRFDSVKKKLTVDTPVVATYNKTALTFVIALGKDIRIVDALTGKVRNEFHEISQTEITACCLVSS